MFFKNKLISEDTQLILDDSLQNSQLLGKGIFLLNKRSFKYPGLRSQDRISIQQINDQLKIFKGKKEISYLNFEQINDLNDSKISSPKLLLGFITAAFLIGGLVDLMSAATAVNLKLQIFSWSQLTVESCIFEIRKAVQALLELTTGAIGIAETVKRLRTDKQNLRAAKKALQEYQRNSKDQ